LLDGGDWLVDAFSYLSLGHVFVANMTGNVVFLGFALAGVGEISIVASLLAVLAFVLGAKAETKPCYFCSACKERIFDRELALAHRNIRQLDN
jgi:uncharacterized membrane protein YoaK (UPF0700 family)